MTDRPNRIQAVENAFDIIESVGELNGCKVRDLSEHMDLPKSTAHIYLKTLEDIGYVVRRDDEYQLGLRFLKTGGKVRYNNNLYQIGRAEVDELAQTTSEVATIGCEENGQRVMLYRTEPAEAIFNNAPTGEFTKMHWTALGKAILSQKSTDQIKEIVDMHGLPRATENTIVDQGKLFEEIESIQSQGYAVEDEERAKGVKSIAVPIESSDGMPATAISVAGPKHDLGTERIQSEIIPALQNTANVIELRARHY